MMSRLTLLPRILMTMTLLLTLLGGMGAGLARLGWPMGGLSAGWALIHGPLMISGFLGTLIALERAVALSSRWRWSIGVPVINLLGTVCLLLFPNAFWPRGILTAASLGLVMLFIGMWRLHPTRDVGIMAAGAVAWLGGNMLWWTGQPIYVCVHAWTAFLILTIVGERLELSRVRRLSPMSVRLLTGAVGVYLLGVLFVPFWLDGGIRILGFGSILMAAWLLSYDLARRTIHQTGLPRYIAACLLLGYGWLAVGGWIGLVYGALYAGPIYAAMLHALLLGFVFSMIFGHAPIILPALTGLKLTYHPIFYGHLAALHLSLAYRLYGTVITDYRVQQWGGLFNVAAVVIFMFVMVLVVKGKSAT